MASNPPGACCLVGVKHEGETVGEVKTIGNFKAYYSYPKDKSTTNAIVIITDVLGYEFPNVRLIADQYAANGYLTVVPNLFGNNPAAYGSPGFDLMGWLKNFPAEVIDPIVDATIKELRGAGGAKTVAGVGYCFGGRYVARFLKKGVLDAGYTAHPSFMSEEELAGIESPFSISAAETDAIFPTEKRHKSEEILLKLSTEKDIPYQINLFSHVVHGFAVRCDLNVKKEKFAKEQAFLQAVTWFNEYSRQ